MGVLEFQKNGIMVGEDEAKKSAVGQHLSAAAAAAVQLDYFRHTTIEGLPSGGIRPP